MSARNDSMPLAGDFATYIESIVCYLRDGKYIKNLHNRI